MGVSAGLARQIIEHPIYNFGLALPFVAAFYLLNTSEVYTIPFFGGAIGAELSAIVRIIGVSSYYAAFMLFFVFFGGLSLLERYESSAWRWLPLSILAMSIIAVMSSDKDPLFGWFFGIFSGLFWVFRRSDDGHLSVILVMCIGGCVSLFSIVMSVLWFYEEYIFADAIARLFGFQCLTPKSLKVGAPMLATVAYSVYYAVFKTIDHWDVGLPPEG